MLVAWAVVFEYESTSTNDTVYRNQIQKRSKERRKNALKFRARNFLKCTTAMVRTMYLQLVHNISGRRTFVEWKLKEERKVRKFSPRNELRKSVYQFSVAYKIGKLMYGSPGTYMQIGQTRIVENDQPFSHVTAENGLIIRYLTLFEYSTLWVINWLMN